MNRLVVNVIKMGLLLLLSILLCRVTQGYFAFVMVLYGLVCSVTRRYGHALCCFALFPLLVISNPYLVPKPTAMGTALRFGPLLIGMGLSLSAMGRRGGVCVPLGGLLLYLCCAVFSSLHGWCPPVSFLKLLNFTLFMVGIWLGTRNLHRYPIEMEKVRVFLLTIACLVVFGSLATLPFPAIAYPLDIIMSNVMKDQGLDAANAYFASKQGGMTLFAGITFHSQALGPLCACLFSLVLADMLFVERKLVKLHLLLLLLLPCIMFMTRSRTALLAFLVGCFMIFVFASKRANVSLRIKLWIRRTVAVSVFFLCFAAIIAEVSGNMVTRWIKKTDDVGELDRNLVDAVTNTRMGLFELSLDEFRRNPMFGMGFQVNYQTPVFYQQSKGLVLSAPVEKGLLPMMVLGEGGVVGALIFLVFLVVFYYKSLRRGYIVTLSLFTVFLATNIGEATFFSPGGAGGILWVMTVVGGFVIDMVIKQRSMFQNPWNQTQRYGVAYV